MIAFCNLYKITALFKQLDNVNLQGKMTGMVEPYEVPFNILDTDSYLVIAVF
jgi:hypothetical protein